MKKRLVIAVVAAAVVLTAGYLGFDRVSPKAEKLSFPDATQVISIAVGNNNSEETKLNPDECERLLAMLNSATPTRNQSVNDSPYVRPYYTVTVATAEFEYRYFVYSENSQTYVEQPYVGIYESDGELIDFILKLNRGA